MFKVAHSISLRVLDKSTYMGNTRNGFVDIAFVAFDRLNDEDYSVDIVRREEDGDVCYCVTAKLSDDAVAGVVGDENMPPTVKELIIADLYRKSESITWFNCRSRCRKPERYSQEVAEKVAEAAAKWQSVKNEKILEAKLRLDKAVRSIVDDNNRHCAYTIQVVMAANLKTTIGNLEFLSRNGDLARIGIVASSLADANQTLSDAHDKTMLMTHADAEVAAELALKKTGLYHKVMCSLAPQKLAIYMGNDSYKEKIWYVKLD